MYKVIIIYVVGVIVAGALFIVPLFQTPITAQTGDTTLAEPLDDAAMTYHEIVTSLLQEAGDEIQDSDIARFYQELLGEYALDQPSSWMTEAEGSSLAEILPDINKIYRTALALPLQEAGKNIQDKEIADFYYRFLEAAGLTIEPD